MQVYISKTCSITCSTNIQQKCNKDMQHGDTDCAFSMYTCCTDKAAWRNGCMQLVHAARTCTMHQQLSREDIQPPHMDWREWESNIMSIAYYSFHQHVFPTSKSSNSHITFCERVPFCVRVHVRVFDHVHFMSMSMLMTIFASNMKMLSVIGLL